MFQSVAMLHLEALTFPKYFLISGVVLHVQSSDLLYVSCTSIHTLLLLSHKIFVAQLQLTLQLDKLQERII